MNYFITPGLPPIKKTELSNFAFYLKCEKIKTIVCEYFDMDPALLKIKSRKDEIVKAKQICQYLIKMNTSGTLKQIAKMFGGIDHTTVMYSITTVRNRSTTDPEYRQDLLNLTYLI